MANAKNRTPRTSAKSPDRKQKSGTPKRERRVILFPDEPTSIDPKLIDEAIRRVAARKKQS